MKPTNFINSQWLAMLAMVMSGFIILFTPYTYTGMLLTIPGLIWLTPFPKHTPNFRALTTNVLLATSCVLFMGNYQSFLWKEEYLALLLILPYIVIAISRLNGVKPKRNEVILFVVTAAIGIWLKPSFIAIPLLVEFLGLSQAKISQVKKRWLITFIGSAIAIPGLFLQFTTYLHRDMAWILYSTKRLMEGAIFGRDVIDSNPPLAWYLSYPVVFLSEVTGWHLANVFRSTVIAGTLLVLLWVASLVNRTPNIDRTPWSINGLLIGAIYVFFITSGLDMGQREYLALLLSLPYMAMAATRLDGFKPTQSEAILVGIIAGIGIAIKPYFLAVPFAIELVVWLIARRLPYFWRFEVIGGLITLITYGLTVLVFAPAYIFEIVPLIQKSYWAYERTSYLSLFRSGNGSFMALVLALFLCRHLSVTPLSYILIAAGFGFSLSYFVQKKGFYYHEFPIRALAIIALTILVVEGVQRSKIVGWKALRSSALLALFTLTFLWAVDIQRMKQQYDGKKRSWVSEKNRGLQDKLITALNRYGPEKTFLAISSNMFPGSPTLIYVRPQWAGIDIFRRYSPAISRLRAQGATATTNHSLAQLERAERHRIMIEMERKPVVVLIQDLEILEFYLEDPKFQKIWLNYREIKPIDSIRVFEQYSKG